MKTALFLSVASLSVASVMSAAAAAPSNRVPPGAPTASTAQRPLAACAFDSPFADSCPFHKPYTPGRGTGGQLLGKAPGEPEGLSHKFDAEFNIRGHRLKHCLARKPTGRGNAGPVVLFPLVRSRYAYANPFPSSLDNGASMGLHKESWTYYSALYCM